MSGIVTIKDIRAAGYCVSGARRWFDSYGLDFKAFLSDGIPVDDFLATGDALAEIVVNLKRRRESVDG